MDKAGNREREREREQEMAGAGKGPKAGSEPGLPVIWTQNSTSRTSLRSYCGYSLLGFHIGSIAL